MTPDVVTAAVLLGVVAVAAGAVLVTSRTATPAGAVTCAAGVAGLFAVWSLTAGDAPRVGALVGTLAGLVLAPLAVVLHPTPPRRAATRAGVLVVLAPGVVALSAPRDVEVVAGAALATGLALVCLTWWRLETEPDARWQLMWSALAVAGCGLGGLAVWFGSDGAPGATAAALVLQSPVPVALVVAALRPATVDIRGLVVGAVVAAVVAIGYTAVFVGVAAAAGLAGVTFDERAYAALGLACAVGVHPSAVVLRGVVDRLLFGDRPDPITAATRVAGRLGDDPAPALDAVRDALAVPWVALRTQDGTTLAASGAEVTHGQRIPLPGHGSGAPAVLHVGLRPGDLTLTAADRRVLDLVAPLLAQILRAQALTAAVAASRGEVVAAREDERRRLRRDLHDGLGPTLTGVAFSVDAARNTVHRDPSAAVDLLDAVRADTVDAIGHIRRIVYGMRPPALDEIGLLGAVRQRADGLLRADGGAVAVTVLADADLPDLPAAVEVAAFRIAVEALTNVARHSDATSVTVRLAVTQRPDGARRLLVEVGDDGTAGGPWESGVGLESMHERAAEVAGVVRFGPTADGGRVEAALPLPD